MPAGTIWSIEDEKGNSISERGNVVSKDLEMKKPKVYRGTIGGPAGEKVEACAKEFAKLVQVLKRRVVWMELSVGSWI